MASLRTERVLAVTHWSDEVFSFTTTRDAGFRFEAGHFVMLGLEVGGKPLMRAFSIASPHYADWLEFLSVKIANGPLTSRLQHIEPGVELLLSSKPVGTLVTRDLKPGKRLFLLATGTGIAPFMSIVQDPDTYERFEQIILAHGTRSVAGLAYRDVIEHVLPQHELLGDQVSSQLIYYPTVTREAFHNQGRLTELISTGKLCNDIGALPLDPATDRVMICGSPGMLKDLSAILDDRGFSISAGVGEPGDYVIERAFADR